MEDLFFLHFFKTGETGSEKIKEKKIRATLDCIYSRMNRIIDSFYQC